MNETVDPRGGWTSASNAAADLRCEGRHLMQKRVPKREEVQSDDALFGTTVHNALLKESPEGLSTQQTSLYEQFIDIRSKVIERVFGGDAPNIKIIKERRFKVGMLATAGDKSPKPDRYEHSGQPDYIARMGSKLLIIEYKALPGDVQASPHNQQLRDQSVLACRQLVATSAITCAIQPLVTHDPELCEYDSIALTKAEAEMFSRVRRSNNPASQRTPNQVSCKFCRATSICSEYQSWATSQLPEAQPVRGVPIANWTPEQRAHFCTMLPAATKWLDDCKEEMKRLLKEDPNCIPGFTLKPGQVRAVVSDPQALFERLVASSKDIPQDELLKLYMECVVVKKGDFEGLTRKATGLKGKALLAELNKLFEGIVTETQNDSSLSRIKE